MARRPRLSRAQAETEERPQGFQRVHRSAVVNLDRVAEIVPFESGDGEARLGSDARVPVSRRYRKELRERLNPSAGH